MKQCVVIGSNGQLGSELVDACAQGGFAVRGLTHADIDIRSIESVTSVLSTIEPSIVINTAAAHGAKQDTAADQAMFFDSNALGPWNLARWCRQHEATLIHYSTDYVFGAEPRDHPYTEDEPTCASTIYGASKVAGEELVRAYCPRHYVIRIASVYGRAGCRAKGGSNFVKMVLGKARNGENLTVVDDQFMSPTWTHSIAMKTIELVHAKAAFGLYHMGGSGYCSWYNFACEIVKIVGAQVDVQAIATPVEGPESIYLRPRYTALDNRGLRQAGLEDLPDWRHALADYIQTEESGGDSAKATLRQSASNT